MLSRITLTNFKSFKNKTEIDLYRTRYKFLEDTNVASNDVLKGALFLGANASGKSNIILAMKLLLDLLFRERNINSGLFKCLFSDNMTFSIDYYFLIADDEIKYSISYDVSKNIFSEKLSINEKLTLDRMGLTAKSYINQTEGVVYDENDIDRDTLFLRTLYFNTKFAGNDTLKSWFEFLQNSVYINSFDKKVISYGKNDLNLLDYLERKGTDEINDFFLKRNFNQSINYSNEDENNKFKILTEGKEKTIFFKRKGIECPIPYSEESLGNRTLLNFLPAILHLTSEDGMLIIDEFSSGFHNELEELLVKYFMNSANLSQIIFVSHSTNLATTSLLRPDQIYSVNFADGEGSWVKRFSDEQPRMAQNMEKMYLSGVFEGLPEYDEN
ncbi:ATP-binding protein [Natroniella acetigena]|uniref:AAA family ATPase n=1 Tax=Natroniella acetigena TaxID=52004 RepID=UPI00200B7FEE|nr:ATP-binding protein [Natroniella acetigena]MCK8828000.1 ATP-binding protein [Natroniella acetigena]